MVKQELIEIKFIKDLEDFNNKGETILKHKKGEIVKASEENAKQFIKLGYAKYIEEQSMERVKNTNKKGVLGKIDTINAEKVKEEEDKLLEKFKDPNLMEEITKELDKDHLEDTNLKKTAFYVAISSLSDNPKLRQSMALVGDTSGGKDNVMKTIVQHIPDSLFLTGATQPALEDQAVYTPLLALSEMNLFKDLGANKDLLEIVKQRTEGGTSNIKKDAETGFKSTKFEHTEQGSTFYGTTDSERNDEMETRFIFGHVSSDEKKIRKVNKNTANSFSNPEKIIDATKTEESWIKKGLRILKKRNGGCQVLIPFAGLLTGKNKAGEDIIDASNPRSMRDLKRIYALICARAWLFSEQRVGCQFEGVNFIKCVPEDMLEVIKDTQECFNQTYSGMDERLNNVIKIINEGLGGWVARDIIQKKLSKSRNTIKEWCKTLADEGLIEGNKGSALNDSENTRDYDYNKIYYRGCQKGIKRVLIRCQYSELKELLKEYIKEEEVKGEYKELNLEQIDTLSLTPSNLTNLNPEYYNLSEEQQKMADEILKTEKEVKR